VAGPEVSVVVPTRDRPEGLAALIAALRAQTLAPERFELIVVDDGSDPPQRPAGSRLALRVIRREHAGGPGAARNAGWRAARAPLVAFVDDDCVPLPAWLEALNEAAAGSDAAIVQGPVKPPPGQRGERGPLSHTIEVAGPDRLFATCNVAYSRPLLERLGGFDESFRRSAEDVDLGSRALKAGADARWAERAEVHHEVRELSVAQMLRHTTKWTYSVAAVRRHPELRDLLVARVFWKPTHPLLLLALAGIASRRPLLAAPYLFHYRARPDRIPLHAVIDLAELATMVAGSVRYRTLML
jgi:glycosyltransferase involved in cell wall biosynthesis